MTEWSSCFQHDGTGPVSHQEGQLQVSSNSSFGLEEAPAECVNYLVQVDNSPLTYM